MRQTAGGGKMRGMAGWLMELFPIKPFSISFRLFVPVKIDVDDLAKANESNLPYLNISPSILSQSFQ